MEALNPPKFKYRVERLVVVVILALGVSFTGSIGYAAVSPAQSISLTGPTGIGYAAVSPAQSISLTGPTGIGFLSITTSRPWHRDNSCLLAATRHRWIA